VDESSESEARNISFSWNKHETSSVAKKDHERKVTRSPANVKPVSVSLLSLIWSRGNKQTTEKIASLHGFSVATISAQSMRNTGKVGV
jgi:hypothetical protein